MKKRIVFALAMLLGASALPAIACEFAFSITDEGGVRRTITPGGTAAVIPGRIYTLSVEFIEDHGKCKLEPEDTDFLLNEEKWKPSKSHLPLLLLEDIRWLEESERTNTTNLRFEARQEGTWTLEIIRDCSKGGYDEFITIAVSAS